jgi:hypothetical protein
MNTILLSDLHIESDSCQVRALQDPSDTLPDTNRLVILGGMLENTEHRLTNRS